MLVRFEQSFFVDYCGMGEVVTLVAAGHCGFIDVETPVALRGVDKRAVRSPAQVALGFGGIGDLFGRTVVDRCHVDIATVYERYGLSVGRCHCIFSPRSGVQFARFGREICVQFYSDFFGLACAGGYSVEFAVVGERHASVGCARKEPDGVCGQTCDGFSLVRFGG